MSPTGIRQGTQAEFSTKDLWRGARSLCTSHKQHSKYEGRTHFWGEGLQVLSQILASVHKPQKIKSLCTKETRGKCPGLALEKFNLVEEDRWTEITQRQGSL